MANSEEKKDPLEPKISTSEHPTLEQETESENKDTEKEPTLEELHNQFGENLEKWQNAINACREKYKNQKFDEDFRFDVGDTTDEVVIPAGENIADNVFLNGSIVFVDGLKKKEIKNRLEIGDLKSKNSQLVFEIEKIQEFYRNVSEKLAQQEYTEDVNKAFDEVPKSATLEIPPDETIPPATETGAVAAEPAEAGAGGEGEPPAPPEEPPGDEAEPPREGEGSGEDGEPPAEPSVPSAEPPGGERPGWFKRTARGTLGLTKGTGIIALYGLGKLTKIWYSISVLPIILLDTWDKPEKAFDEWWKFYKKLGEKEKRGNKASE